MMEIIFSKERFKHQQELLGKRPGDYRLDPYYLRTGIADKPYFWNDSTRKWERVSLGDLFTVHDDGTVTRTPVAEVRSKAS